MSPVRRSRDHRASRVLRAAAVGAVVALLPSLAVGAVRQPTVVSRNPVGFTPQLVDSRAVPWPRIDALGVDGARTYAGGLFDTVRQGGRTHTGLANLMAFSTSTGAVDPDFDPRFNGPVKAVEVDPTGGVFVGGDFTAVNGTARAGLVRLGSAGRVDTSFKPPFRGGLVNDLEVTTIAGKRRLLVGGNIGGKLVSLNPETGANTGHLDAVFRNAIPGARGGVTVFKMSVSPDRKRLIATGNFRTVTVDGRSSTRRGFVMLGLPTSTRQTRVSPWYYPGFAKECQATDLDDARRIANLQGVDWSPSGNYFNVAATGKIPRSGDVWHAWDTDAGNAGSSVCDAVGRFELADDRQAVWINYTGGDSLWTVQDTGAAVYVQGHMQYMDNPDGFASRPIGDRRTGAPAVLRKGVAAVDPATGKAVRTWAPHAPARKGGKALLVTGRGVWWGSDSLRFADEPHRGLAFTPLP